MLRMRWWNRLGVKLAAAITLCSILTMALLLVLLLRSQRRHLLGIAELGREEILAIFDSALAFRRDYLRQSRKSEAA